MRNRSLVAIAATALLLGVPLAACGGDDDDDSAASGSTTTKPAADEGSGDSSCGGGLEAGKDGVVRIFCDGPATAKVTIGATTTNLTGGSCDESGGYYTINFGTVVGPDFTGDKPDYIGALFPDGGGAPEAVTVRVGGAGGGVFGANGNVSTDKESVHLDGKASDGSTVSVDIGC